MFHRASDPDGGCNAAFLRTGAGPGAGPRHYWDQQHRSVLPLLAVQKRVRDFDSTPAPLKSPHFFTFPSVSSLRRRSVRASAFSPLNDPISY